MSKYLFRREGIFYIRCWVPKELRSHIPVSNFAKSLKTGNSDEAELLALDWRKKWQSAFSLLRANFLDEQQVVLLLSSILPSSPKQNHTAFSLSELIDLYIKEHSPSWTAKTRMEYEGQFKLLLNPTGLHLALEIICESACNNGPLWGIIGVQN